jgi:hypothetical protein
MKEGGMLSVEEQQQVHNGVPRIRALRLDEIGSYLTVQPRAGAVVLSHLCSVHGHRRYRGAVEDAYVLRKRGDHEIGVGACEFLRGDGGPAFHQDVEPHGETTGERQ